MSEELAVSEIVTNITEFLGKQEKQFANLNENCPNQLDFLKESQFALQLLTKNDYLLGVARSNPDSLQAAISNVAAIGITLNPAFAFAYLVPRKVNGVLCVCLDISYRGLVKLATDTGIITAMKAELVYENDTFHYHGFHEKPDFEGDPFNPEARGELKGVYAMALMSDGQVLVETMSIKEVFDIRDDTEAYKSVLKKHGIDSYQFKNLGWVKYEGEFVKKTVIKRAYKTLPTSKGMESVGKAIEVINEHEGINFEEKKQIKQTFYTDQELIEYRRCVDESDFYNLSTLVGTLCAESQMDLHTLCVPEAPKGMKGEAKAKRKEELENASNEVESSIAFLKEHLDEGNDSGAQEILSECSQWTRDYFLSCLSTEQQIEVNKLTKSA